MTQTSLMIMENLQRYDIAFKRKGKAKTVSTYEKMSSPERFKRYLKKLDYWQLPFEHFVVIAVDTQCKPLGYAVTNGREAECWVNFRAVAKFLLDLGACRFLVSHNHPSRSSKPSREDIVITEKIEKWADALGMQMLDHMITWEEDGDMHATSYKDEPHLWK